MRVRSALPLAAESRLFCLGVQAMGELTKWRGMAEQTEQFRLESEKESQARAFQRVSAQCMHTRTHARTHMRKPAC